ncbi:MAG: S9 family peptidase, partial [Actinomycetota bacterium]
MCERTDPEWIDVMPGVPTRTPSGAVVEIVADRGCDTNRLVVDSTAITPPALQVEAVLDAGDDDVLIVAGRDPVRSAVCRVTPDGSVTEVLTGGTVGARRA